MTLNAARRDRNEELVALRERADALTDLHAREFMQIVVLLFKAFIFEIRELDDDTVFLGAEIERHRMDLVAVFESFLPASAELDVSDADNPYMTVDKDDDPPRDVSVAAMQEAEQLLLTAQALSPTEQMFGFMALRLFHSVLEEIRELSNQLYGVKGQVINHGAAVAGALNQLAHAIEAQTASNKGGGFFGRHKR